MKVFLCLALLCALSGKLISHLQDLKKNTFSNLFNPFQICLIRLIISLFLFPHNYVTYLYSMQSKTS